MKTPEDEAFDDLARNQGAWGGGFPAKRAMAADKLQEPAEWLTGCPTCGMDAGCDCDTGTWSPPQREWVGLTGDELADLWYKESLDWMEFARAHEAKLKEKNT